MGNTTNPERWDVQRRLEFIELAAFWRGWIQRSDLTAEFGLSLPQTSSDIQAFLSLHPDSLQYDLKAKRYLGVRDMTLKLASFDLAQAVARFLGKDEKSSFTGARFASIDLPFRVTPPAVARDLFRSVIGSMAVEVHYLSIHGSSEAWRLISPHAFAYDGYRWHVRAFCHRDQSYKDFVVGRISKAKPPEGRLRPTIADEDWNSWETIRLKPHSGLTQIQRRAIELDFEMKRGVVDLKVRKSMRNYTLAYLGLLKSRSFPELLELDHGS